MSYRCTFTVLIAAKDGCTAGSLRVDLPFAPVPGIAFFGIMELDGDGVDAKRVVYSIDDRSFAVELPTEFEADETLDEMKAIYIGEWEWRVLSRAEAVGLGLL